ncbi:SGNH hydrolase, partial [candidate division KSB1 bacterium]
MNYLIKLLGKTKFCWLVFGVLLGSYHPLLGQWKIMPLGDSITYGDSTGGFRDDLHTLLSDEGVDFDFVGSLQSGTLPDRDNEG